MEGGGEEHEREIEQAREKARERGREGDNAHGDEEEYTERKSQR